MVSNLIYHLCVWCWLGAGAGCCERGELSENLDDCGDEVVETDSGDYLEIQTLQSASCNSILQSIYHSNLLSRFLCDIVGVSMRSRSPILSLYSLSFSSWYLCLLFFWWGFTGKNEGLGVPELPVEPVALSSPVYTSFLSSAYTPSLKQPIRD